VQQIIDHLQDDPDLIRMKISPANNPNEIQVGTSDPELIDIDEIVGLDSPEITTPQDGSPGGVSIQPETIETSGRSSTLNPLN
jgi:hypothetical protein